MVVDPTKRSKGAEHCHQRSQPPVSHYMKSGFNYLVLDSGRIK